MAAKSARKLLQDAPTITVRLRNVKQIDKRLVVLSFIIDKVRYDDIFSVKDASDMRTLLRLLRAPRKKCMVELSVNQDDPVEGHPDVVSVTIS